MVNCVILLSGRQTKLFLEDICQMAIMSDAIKNIVAKFDDSDHDVCNTAINSLVKLAKHGNLYNSFI